MRSNARFATRQKIAKRYALSLFSYAQEKKSVDAIAKDLNKILAGIEQSGEFQAFLQDQSIAFRKFKTVIEAVLKTKLDSETWRFLDFLKHRDRLNILREICVEFEKLYLEYKGILKVKIISARELKPEQLENIAKRLKAKFDKNIDYEVEIDPTLIAGFKVQVGDSIYDFSVENQLEKFKNRILSKE